MLKKISLILNLVFIVTLIIVLIFHTEKNNHLGNGIKKHGYLKVEGRLLLDQNNNQIQLTGVSSHGINWYPEYVNSSMLSDLRNKGANVFRLSIYTSGKDGYINNKEKTLKQIRLLLENVLYLDMYVVIDWHILEDNNPLMNVNDAIEFFDELSSLYPNNPGIIYEICNEPNKDTSWDDIKDYSNQVIPIIRKNSPDSLIIVGTPKHCTDLKSIEGNELHFKNIMYSFHYYTKKGKNNYKYILSRAIEKNIPVFISEWGINSGQDQFKMGSNFLKYINENNFSWINWSLSNKDEAYSIIKNKCTNIDLLSKECLTKTGELIINNF